MRVALVITAVLALACGGAGSEGAPDSLHTWIVKPTADQEVRLDLVLEDRVAVFVDGTHKGELTIPLIPQERWDSPGFVESSVDIDFDGVNDLQVRDDDASGAYNHAYHWYRFDPSSQTYVACEIFNGLHNVGANPDTERVFSTTLGNGVGASGSETYFQANGGCSFIELGTMSWDIAMSNGRGDAKCTLPGEVEPIWRMPVTEKPTRACPE